MCIWSYTYVNPWTYMQIHTPTVWYKGGGGGEW